MLSSMRGLRAAELVISIIAASVTWATLRSCAEICDAQKWKPNAQSPAISHQLAPSPFDRGKVVGA
jgi:hypothetical protein